MTIDCPSDCVHLIDSRAHSIPRRELDLEKAPFPTQRISNAALEAHEPLFSKLMYVLCEFASENPALVDGDIQAAATAAAEAFQTLASGIFYENPPAYHLQAELYGKLRKTVEEYKQEISAGFAAMQSVRDSEIRDFLILFAQISFLRSNGRPKGRAFLDVMRSQFKPGTFDRQASKIILAP